MLRANAAHCQPGYHLGFCSVCSFVEFSLGRRRQGFLGVVYQFIVFNEKYFICYFWKHLHSNLLPPLVRKSMLHLLVFWIHPFGISFCEAALPLSLPFPPGFSQHCICSRGACVWAGPAFPWLQTPVLHPNCLAQGELVPARNLHYWEVSLWLSDISLFLLSCSVLSLLSALSSSGDSAGATGVCAALSLVYPVY